MLETCWMLYGDVEEPSNHYGRWVSCKHEDLERVEANIERDFGPRFSWDGGLADYRVLKEEKGLPVAMITVAEEFARGSVRYWIKVGCRYEADLKRVVEDLLGLPYIDPGN